MRGETCSGLMRMLPLAFQSTPLMRGETHAVLRAVRLRIHFNPLPSCEGRLGVHRMIEVDYPISIHSPHTRGDVLTKLTKSSARYFNPLPSHEGRRFSCALNTTGAHFNPLPSYEGRRARRGKGNDPTHFNPLPSHEGRPHLRVGEYVPVAFQSTPLIRGETKRSRGKQRQAHYFNPLPSYEGRHRS